MSSIMFLDLETNNHEYFGAVASPRHPENFVVMNGYAIEAEPYKGEIKYDHYPHKEDVPAQWLNIPDDVWLLVMHNAPYEMDWFLFQQRPQIMAFLQRGGRIFCTAYAEYLLSHQTEMYPSLDETAPKYGGTHKVDGIKVLWNQGVKTKDIDPALLAEYLAGPGGDVANTRLIFYGQYTKATQAGMWNMLLERMEGLIFNCLAMDSGLFVDREVAFKQRDEGEARLVEINESLRHWRSHIPDYVNFKPSSDWHMSAWLFGGPIKYVGRVPALNEDGTNKYVKADFVRGLDGKLHQIVPDESGEWADMDLETLDFDLGPLERYKSGKNKGRVKVFREDTDEIKLKNADLLFSVGPLVDLSLLPKDIRKEFDREFSGKREMADGSPVYSTGADCLDMLAERKEFPEHVQDVIKLLKEWAKIDKDMGTYYLRQELNDDGVVVKQSGMLKYLTERSIVYHGLNATATVTTRLSSTNPNFQNLPRGNTSSVKKMFRSRFNDRQWLLFALSLGLLSREFYDECISRLDAGLINGYIVEADYSALEVVTMCAFTKDTALTKALLEGTDMHCLRLAKALHEPYEVVLDKAKNQEHPEFKHYDNLRTLIKPKAFSYQYGATAQGIAFSTGCTVQEAQEFIDTEKALFPEVEAWFDEDGPVVTQVRSTGEVHREQTDNGGWRVYKRGYWQSPGGTCYSFRQMPKAQWINGQRVETMDYKMTQIRNYPIQGESGFFVQGISGRIARNLIANGFYGGRVYVINTVHDAYYFDVYHTALDELCGMVKETMEDLPRYFNEKFGYDLHVPFPAAVEFGRSMHEKLHWHPGVLQDPKVQEKLGIARAPELLAA